MTPLSLAICAVNPNIGTVMVQIVDGFFVGSLDKLLTYSGVAGDMRILPLMWRHPNEEDVPKYNWNYWYYSIVVLLHIFERRFIEYHHSFR